MMLGSITIIVLMVLLVTYFSFAGGAIMNVLSFVLLFLINWLLLLISNCKNESSVDN